MPAFNEERLIGSTLDALRQAGTSLALGYEIIVVDDGSTDRTADVAGASGARVVRVVKRQIAATRNAGARLASGAMLIFVDADTIVNADVVSGAVRAIQSGAVGGGATVRFEGRLPGYARLLDPCFRIVVRAARVAAGCFLFCRRDAFETVGGFDERLYGAEEVALSCALKHLGRFVILRQSVTTSGRKLRAYSGWEVLWLLGRVAVRGRRVVETRDDLYMWYQDRRDDSA